MPIVLPPPGPEIGANAGAGIPTIPHFAFPFTFTAATGALVNEQDSLDDVFDCVQAIATCPVGARPDIPTFGVPTALFAQAPLDVTGLARAITRWEPRSSAAAVEYPDLYSAATRHVQVSVSIVQPDQ